MHIDGNRLVLDCRSEVQFDHEFEEVLDFGEVLVVLLRIPAGTKYNRNVFGISKADGKVLWQIVPASISLGQVDAPYVGMRRSEDGCLHATNWEGVTMYLNPVTGREVKKWTWVKLDCL